MLLCVGLFMVGFSVHFAFNLTFLTDQCCWLLANGKCFTSSHAQQYLDEKFNLEIEYFPSQLRYVRVTYVSFFFLSLLFLSQYIQLRCVKMR